MSEVNDRGTKKWTAMMMPEHEEMLQQMWREQEYKKKPILDEQKQFELNTKLQLALQNDLTVEVEYYDYGAHDFQKIKGKLLLADTLTNALKFDNEENLSVPLEDVMEVVID
ncbi:YolD-like family protein [Lentibacillus sp. CBA3610]|uniref:YolD-like family protein n=1 Tax=Lentibacillus sp. CBA3610 TaxID=2518176 RepID=UPI001595CD96|nr:YolD-like family protein [Lentibacillus sp. CBA3610]